MDVYSDPRCLLHEPPLSYPERPQRLLRIREGLSAAGRPPLDRGPHPAAAAAVERVHGVDYVARLRAAVERGDGIFDSADNPLVASTWDAAWGAVEATLHATDAIC